MRKAAIGLEVDARSQRWLAGQRTEAQRKGDEKRAEAANERRGAGGKLTCRASAEAPQAPRPPALSPQKTSAAIAERLGVSRATVERAAERHLDVRTADTPPVH